MMHTPAAGPTGTAARPPAARGPPGTAVNCGVWRIQGSAQQFPMSAAPPTPAADPTDTAAHSPCAGDPPRYAGLKESSIWTVLRALLCHAPEAPAWCRHAAEHTTPPEASHRSEANCDCFCCRTGGLPLEGMHLLRRLPDLGGRQPAAPAARLPPVVRRHLVPALQRRRPRPQVPRKLLRGVLQTV